MPMNAAQPCHGFENKRHLLDHLLCVEEPLEPTACPDGVLGARTNTGAVGIDGTVRDSTGEHGAVVKGEDGALVTGDDGTLAVGAPVAGTEDDAIDSVDEACDDEGPGVVEDDVRSTGDADREGSLPNAMADINTNDSCRHE